MLKSELKILESFSNFLDDWKKGKSINYDQKDETGIKKMFTLYRDELSLVNYFKFIPKTKDKINVKIAEAKLKLAIDLNNMFKYYQIQSYLIGINCLYFSLLFIKSRKVFGFSSIFSILLSSGLAFYLFRYHYNKIFRVMDIMFNEDVRSLYNRIRREENGFDFNVRNNLTYLYNTITLFRLKKVI